MTSRQRGQTIGASARRQSALRKNITSKSEISAISSRPASAISSSEATAPSIQRTAPIKEGLGRMVFEVMGRRRERGRPA